MPHLAYFTIAAVIVAILAVVLFFAVNPLAGIFTILVAQFILKLEDRNE